MTAIDRHFVMRRAGLAAILLAFAWIGQAAVQASESSALSVPPQLFPGLRNECGPLALAAVCELSGIEVTPDRIKALTHYDPYGGTTLADLAKAAQQLGLHCQGVRCGVEDLQAMLEKGISAIVPYGRRHFAVVLSSRQAGRILLMDLPAGVVVDVDPQAFAQNWNGMALCIATDPHRLPVTSCRWCWIGSLGIVAGTATALVVLCCVRRSRRSGGNAGSTQMR